MKTVYLAGPITGLTYEQATIWRNNAKTVLRSKGYRCIDPMEGEADTLNEHHPDLHRRVSEIVHLDKYYVDQSDIIFVNFEHYDEKMSVGTISELAWAWSNGSIIVAVVPDGCPYDRAWLNVLYTFKCKTYHGALQKVKEIQ